MHPGRGLLRGVAAHVRERTTPPRADAEAPEKGNSRRAAKTGIVVACHEHRTDVNHASSQACVALTSNDTVASRLPKHARQRSRLHRIL